VTFFFPTSGGGATVLRPNPTNPTRIHAAENNSTAEIGTLDCLKRSFYTNRKT